MPVSGRGDNRRGASIASPPSLSSLPLPLCAHRWHTIRQCWLCSMHVGGGALLSWAFLYLVIFLDFMDSDGSLFTCTPGRQVSILSMFPRQLQHCCCYAQSEVWALTSPFIQSSQEPGEGHGMVNTNWAVPREGRLSCFLIFCFLFCSSRV